MTHVRIWRFRPAPGCEQEFAAAYAGDGPWARLFRQAPGFIGASLLAPDRAGGLWLTLERWQSQAAFERFQDEHGATYRALDLELERLTVDELFIGAFEE
ncbi:MAG: antibiotic biosynthesis monooxygenase family protein [Sphingomicrobium sp.]